MSEKICTVVALLLVASCTREQEVSASEPGLVEAPATELEDEADLVEVIPEEPRVLPHQEQVMQDVRQLLNALYEGDAETVLGFTHPGVVAAVGGVEATREALQQAVDSMAASEMRLESLGFPGLADVFPVGERYYAVVPTLAIIAVEDGRMESLNYQVGILEPGVDGWKYAEGSRMNERSLPKLFPGFPEDYELPEVRRRAL